MRIIAGTLGGRHFASPRGQRTHPMSDKMRGALFNALGDIQGLVVLDAFAGSGALGFEALSRGAARVLAIDRDRQAQRIILENRAALGLDDSLQVVKASASAWLTTTTDKFDLILLDPPYDNVQPKLLRDLCQRLLPGGRVILSWPPREPLPELPGLQQQTLRQYGDGQLVFMA